MNQLSDLTEIERLAFSISNLIDALIHLFPEGISEEFDKSIFLTLLEKAKEDAETLKEVIKMKTI